MAGIIQQQFWILCLKNKGHDDSLILAKIQNRSILKTLLNRKRKSTRITEFEFMDESHNVDI